MTRRRGWLDRTLLLAGGLLLALWALAVLHQQLFAAWDRAGFDPVDPEADTREWSAGRIAAYLDARAPFATERLALLEIPSIDLEVVVLEGTDDWTLNRGVGRIEGTAVPGLAGNAGIAGHRDGFFRGLERVKEGDVVELTLRGRERSTAYRIEWIRVVDPGEVWVLEPTEQPSLTLVTCHPFYFVGHAPDRYVVRAVASP